MRITIYSKSELFKFGFQCLMSDANQIESEEDLHLHVVDLMDKSGSLSFVKMLEVTPLEFSALKNIILIVNAGFYLAGCRLQGVTVISGNATLKQWCYLVKRAAKGEYVNIDDVHQLSRSGLPNQFSVSEKKLTRFLTMNMSPSAIASVEEVSVKTLYSRINALKHKCMLSSTRELYLNAEYIYQQMTKVALAN